MDRWKVAALGAVAVALGTVWWVAVLHPEMWMPLAALLTILAGMFYFAPLAYARGERTLGVGLVLITLLLGPASLVLLVPWAIKVRREGDPQAA